MLDEMVGLEVWLPFFATPVAGWFAFHKCCSVLSVLLGDFPIACHEPDTTSALASLRLLSVRETVGCLCSPQF